jgi:hypothetical protein
MISEMEILSGTQQLTNKIVRDRRFKVLSEAVLELSLCSLTREQRRQDT